MAKKHYFTSFCRNPFKMCKNQFNFLFLEAAYFKCYFYPQNYVDAVYNIKSVHFIDQETGQNVYIF